MKNLPSQGTTTDRVTSPVGCGAFATSDAEAQALLIAHEAGGESFCGSCALGPLWEAQPAPPLPRAVVILGAQWCDSDGILRLHHPLPEDCHGDGAS